MKRFVLDITYISIVVDSGHIDNIGFLVGDGVTIYHSNHGNIL